MLAQILPPIRALGKIRAILHPIAKQHMHHRQRQQPIRPRVNDQVLIRQRRRARFERINDDQLRALAASLFNERPKVNVVAMHVAAPHQDQTRMRKIFRRRAQLHTVHTRQRRPASARADRAIQLRSSQPVKEPPVHRPVSKLPNRSRIAVGQNALRPVLRRNQFQFQPYQHQRFVPRHGLECLRFTSLWQRTFRHATLPAHGHKQTLRRVHAIQIPCHLAAQKSACHRVRRITLHLQRAPGQLIHRHQHATRVRAVVRANRMHLPGQSCLFASHGKIVASISRTSSQFAAP